MNHPNSHIEEFLHYYCAFEHEPSYAVLLKGKWGTGKTWFVKHVLEELKEKGVQFLYVSLYGIASYDDIEDEFFKQLHPRLSSKSMDLAGKIVKGLVKTTLKIDLNNDGQADGSVSSQVPEMRLPEYLTNTTGFVIVFDDIERASINLHDLLGYINHYVEHQGYKVILIANEDEILSQQKSNDITTNVYQRIKEKLIGKTFELTPHLNQALDAFLSTIDTPCARKIYEQNVDIISSLYLKSQYHNLRHLKQALWDFERLTQFVDDSALSKDELMGHLLQLFLIFSFEIKSGNILPKAIARMKSSYYSSMFDYDKNQNYSIYEAIIKKYRPTSFDDLLLDESIWIDIFDKGKISPEKIKESLEKSKYFRSELTPSWVNLWHSMNLTDDEFKINLNSVLDDLKHVRFTDVGIVKHVVGTLLWLSSINLIDYKTDKILDLGYSNVEHLKKIGKLKGIKHNAHAFRDDEVWGGLGFHYRGTDEFSNLNKFIVDKSNEAEIERLPKLASELMQLMVDDIDSFYRKVLIGHEDGSYYDVPILKYMPSNFVEVFLSSIKPSDQMMVCCCLKQRYENTFYLPKICSELSWLEQTIKLLRAEEEQRKGNISSYQIQCCLTRYLLPAKELLLEYEGKVSNSNI